MGLVLASCVTPPVAPGNVSLRPDGTPGPEPCPAKALEVMSILGLEAGMWSIARIDRNQVDVSPIRVYDGPVEGMLMAELGSLPAGTLLYGKVWTGGPQVVIRYFEVKPPDRRVLPICAVARLAEGHLRKLPGSVPGMAILEHSNTGVDVVDAFR